MDAIEQDLSITGSIQVQRDPQDDGADVDSFFPGFPHRDGGAEPDGFDDIKTTIVSMNLSVTSVILGVVNVTGTGGGAIEEKAQGTGFEFPAISWLDSELTLSTVPYGDLIATAVHAEGTVDFLPAVGAVHQILNTSVEFKDAGGTTRVKLTTLSCTPDGAVGGIVELRVTSGNGPESASPSESTAGSAAGPTYGLLAAAIAAAVMTAAAGAWYARTRWLK